MDNSYSAEVAEREHLEEIRRIARLFHVSMNSAEEIWEAAQNLDDFEYSLSKDD